MPDSDRQDSPPPTGRGGRSLAARIGAAVLVGALVPIVVLALLTFESRSRQLRESALDQLDAMASIQQARVEAYLRSAHTAARLVASRTQLRRSLDQLVAGDDRVADDVTAILIDARNSVDGLVRASVTDRSGRVLASTDDALIGSSVEEVTSLDLTSPDAVATRAKNDHGGPHLSVVTPAALDGRVLGAIEVGLSLQPLTDLATGYTGLGATGETLVAQRTDDGAALFLTPLRFDPGAQLQRTIPPDRTAVPITIALDRRATVLDDASDYRDVDVFAATRYLPISDWGLVVKIDRVEALAPIADLRRLLLGVGALALAIVVALATLLARSLTQPIRQLTDAARRGASGDLSVRADVQAPGEIGELGTAFNQMTAALQRSTEELEALVEERTRELSRTIDELERRNAELDAFSGIVAHDLRSPLTTVQGILDATIQGMIPADRLDDYLQRGRRAARQMNELIEDLLALARAGTIDIGSSDVALGAVIQEVLDERDLGGIVELDALPTVTGDRRSLRQVFDNLIGNAVKYAADDVPPRVRIASERTDNRWRITVDDNGIGIPEDEREQVLEPFARGSSVASMPGTGVGLGIVARVVERHGGHVEIEDSPLGGTRVSLTLPASTSDIVEPATRRHIEQRG